MVILQANNVCKTFGTHAALHAVNIEVERGTVYGLLGPNGAGKTTLIRIINQILAPDSGEIIFNGRKLHANDVSRIGYLPEERGLYKKMKVGEQAIYLAQLKGLTRNEALKRLTYWFEKFEIKAWWDKKIEELSKGMAQKVQFVTTIIHEPELLIFDEPFSGFDPINANMLKNEILDLKTRGATILFSTHNMASVEELCDNISLINKSEVILSGQVDEIRLGYKTGIYEVQFNGHPESFKNTLSNDFELTELKSGHLYHTAKVRMLHKVSENALLQQLIQAVQITSFKEVLPGMNEVFIAVVNDAENNVN